MKRLITGLAVLVLAGLMAACAEDAAVTGPAVSAKWAPQVDLRGGSIYTVTLMPTGSPSGVIAFKSVRDGKARTLTAYRFTGIVGPGAAVVQVGSRAIDVSWTLPGSGAWLKSGRALLPPGSQAFGTAWSGERLGSGGLGGERILWAQDRYLGASPSSGELPMGELDALVEVSRQHPERTSYCLTLELEAP